MYWTLELASKLEDAPWPATKDELIDYAMRSGAPLEVIENLQEMKDEDEIHEGIEDIWPDYLGKEDLFFSEEEYRFKETEHIRIPDNCCKKLSGISYCHLGFLLQNQNTGICQINPTEIRLVL